MYTPGQQRKCFHPQSKKGVLTMASINSNRIENGYHPIKGGEEMDKELTTEDKQRSASCKIVSDKELLTIKDLQQGMMVRIIDDTVSAEPFANLESLVIHHVHTPREGYLGDGYAIGYDTQGIPWLLLEHYKLMLVKEKTVVDEYTTIVICSVCGRQMEIKEWMQAFTWIDCPNEFMIPDKDKAHECVCGKLWTVSNELTIIGNILVWK